MISSEGNAELNAQGVYSREYNIPSKRLFQQIFVVHSGKPSLIKTFHQLILISLYISASVYIALCTFTVI